VVLDAFLLVSQLVILISARRVLYFISAICFSPLIRVPKGVFGVLEPRKFCRGARSPKAFSTWSPDRNTDSGQIKPWIGAIFGLGALEA